MALLGPREFREYSCHREANLELRPKGGQSGVQLSLHISERDSRPDHRPLGGDEGPWNRFEGGTKDHAVAWSRRLLSDTPGYHVGRVRTACKSDGCERRASGNISRIRPNLDLDGIEYADTRSGSHSGIAENLDLLG